MTRKTSREDQSLHFSKIFVVRSSHGHKKQIFIRTQRESQQKVREKSFYVHMRNKQSLPNQQITFDITTTQ